MIIFNLEIHQLFLRRMDIRFTREAPEIIEVWHSLTDVAQEKIMKADFEFSSTKWQLLNAIETVPFFLLNVGGTQLTTFIFMWVRRHKHYSISQQ